MIAQGAPAAIMERLGHSSVTVLIDTEGDRFPALGDVSDGLERTYRPLAPTGAKSLVVQMWSASVHSGAAIGLFVVGLGRFELPTS